ncbi:carbonic anhydrase, partial [Eggerthella sp.]
IAVCELGVEDIMIVAHTNCGAQHMSGKEMVANMERLGVSAERIEFARHCGIDFDKWLAGFGDTEEAVRKSVDMVANHPVMPPHVRVIGFIMDSDTGKLSVVC